MSKSRICAGAEAFVAEEPLRAEGFKEIAYIEVSKKVVPPAIADGGIDFSLNFAINHIQAIDHGAPLTILTGVHSGCYELFAREGLGGITELKGKQVGLQAGSPALLRLMAAQVGLDPEKDFQWVIDPKLKSLDLFAEGKVAANSDYVRRYPIATKRALRAILRAADLCVNDAPAVARRLIDSGVTRQYDYALQTISEMRYDRWRDYDAEDTVRFYALRLHEAGMIKSTPKKIIAQNTDWRFLDELKRELKA